MKLKKCYIENFGKLQNYTHEFKDGLNTIKEENGFGKTTFATFVKSMFYGLDASNKAENSDRKKYKPWQGGAFGGNIEFEIQGKNYRIERFFGSKASEDTFKLYDLETNLESKDYTENIGEEIFKINKSGYERSTYIPQGQIQIEMEDSLNAKLGNVLESENDVNTSDEAIKKITETMKIYKKQGNKGLLNEKKEKLNELQRKLENSKSDITNLEVREKILNNINLKIKQNEEIKKQKQELLAKKIEQGRKQAKQETYNNILAKLHENEEKYNKLESFFESDVPEDNRLDELTQKTIEIEKNKVELNNNNLTQEEEKNLEDLRTKFKDFKESEFDKKNINISKILLIIGIIAVILGIVLMILNIPKIVGAIIAILGVVICIISIIKAKNKEIQDKEIANLKIQYTLYKDLENKKANQDKIKQNILEKIENLEKEIQEFLLKYFSIIDKPFTDLIQEIKLKKNELMLVMKEVESSRKLKENYESQNNIEEFKEDDNLNNINEENLNREIKILENEQDNLNDEKNQNKNMIEILENKIDENDYIENDIENLKEEIENLEEKYTILEKTKDLLSLAKENFSSSYLKDMVNGFKHYLKLIDNKELDTNVDINLDVKVDVNGAKKEIKYFSVGYKDLIYICMRFSLIKALFKDEQPFIILDDPFVNLDDNKTPKAIELVNQLAKEFQVIYLVCNESRI